MQRIIILHEGRCGSTALYHKLLQSKKCLAFGEVLSKNVSIGPNFGNSELYTKRQNSLISFNYLNEYLSEIIPFHRNFNNPNYDSENVVFELKVNQLLEMNVDINIFIRKFLSLGYYLVFLYRENTLRRIISNEKALKNSVWHINKNSERSNLESLIEKSNVKFTLDLQKTFCPYQIDNLKTINENIRLSLQAINKIKIFAESYSDNFDFLTQDDVKTCSLRLSRLFRLFFDIDVPSENYLIETNNQPLREILQNYRELESNLDPDYSWMLV